LISFASSGSVATHGAKNPEILQFGLPGFEISAVEHGKRISVYCKDVPVAWLFTALHGNLDGPRYHGPDSFQRTVSLAAHHITWKQLLARILVGTSYYFTYEGDRITRVRVIGEIQGKPTPARASHESLAEWTRIERESMGLLEP